MAAPRKAPAGKAVNTTARPRNGGKANAIDAARERLAQSHREGRHPSNRVPSCPICALPAAERAKVVPKPADGAAKDQGQPKSKGNGKANGNGNGNGRTVHITTTDDVGMPGYDRPVTLVVRWKIDLEGRISNRVLSVMVRGRQVDLATFAAKVAKASGDDDVDDLSEWVLVATPKAKADHRATLTAYVQRQGFTVTSTK